MDYAEQIQSIIEQLQADKTADPKWRNKTIARLEEAQVFTIMLDPMADDPAPNTAALQNFPGIPDGTRVTLNDIPESLREYADPDKIKGVTPYPPTQGIGPTQP